MSNTLFSFILTTLSGLSTLIGIIPIFINFKNINKVISYSIIFAAGIMFSISIFDLIPATFIILRNYYREFLILLISFTCIIAGVILSNIFSNILVFDNSLYKVGIISMLSVIIHNIPEGIITFISTTKSTKIGLSLAIAIALHNIPEGISIAIPIYYSTKNRVKTIKYVLLAAISEMVGAIITYLFLYKYINNVVLGILYSLIGGLMINISLVELIPESLKYNNNIFNKLFFLLGIVIMLMVLYLT